MGTRDGTAPENIAFCLSLVARVPALTALWAEHLDDQFGEPLPYIFLNDVAAWAEENSDADPTSVSELITMLNSGLEDGDGDAWNLVLAGCVEGLSGSADRISQLHGPLKPWVEYEFGLVDGPPS